MIHFSPTEPVWQYEAETEALTEVETLHMILWPKGLCITGFTAEGIPLKAETFFFERVWDHAALEYLLQNDPLFAGPQPITCIWIAEDRNMLIPEAFYEENYADEWIRKFHFLEADETLTSLSLKPYVEAQIVFPLSDKVQELLRTYLPEGRINTLSKAALSHKHAPDMPVLEVISLPQMVLLTLQHNGRFILHQAYPYDSTDNVVYKIALLLQEKDIPQDKVTVLLSGLAPFWDNLNTGLYQFFPPPDDQEDTTRITLSFFNKLFSCAS